MDLEIAPPQTCVASFTEEDLPLSPVFIDFLAYHCDGCGYSHQGWFDQLNEDLCAAGREMTAKSSYRLQRLAVAPFAQSAMRTVYRWFTALSTDASQALGAFHRRFRFIVIVGSPRTGGSYLTGELYAALGYSPTSVPAGVAHDGFPEARPYSQAYDSNTWIATIARMSEFLTMIELYFSDRNSDDRITVPKKATKAIYAPGFFKLVLGASAEYVVTVRHPIGSCISTFEKSGGLPKDGKFRVRSAMEKWIKRDIVQTGVDAREVDEMDYFSAYIRYWEQFYMSLALSGLVANRVKEIVPFGATAMEHTAGKYHKRFNSALDASRFVASERAYERYPQWISRGEQAIARVASAWHLVGLPFPEEEIARCA